MRTARIRYYPNVRGIISLAAVSLAAALCLYFLWGYQENRVLGSGLEQIKAFREAGADEKLPERRERDYDLALRHLNQYLDFRPDDAEGLEIKAELLTAVGDLLGAAAVYEHLLRAEAAGARAQQARRRLAAVYIQFSDFYRFGTIAQLMPEETSKQLRYRAAELRADQLLAENAKANPPVDDAEAHRLRAMALEGQIVPDKNSRFVVVAGRPKEKKTLEEAAILEYQNALALDPGDLIAVKRLADLYQKSKDMAAARGVLNGLLRARTDVVDVRLIRYEFFKNNGDAAAAADELEAAARLAPENLTVILTAAENALGSGSGGIGEARRWLDKVPERWRDDPRVLGVRGMIEYTGQDFEATISTWRKALERSNTSDVGLTQRLAVVLLELGRDGEAATLVTQYRRLVGDEDPVLRFLEGIQDAHAGRFSRAIERLEGARDRLPEGFQTSLHMALGECQERQGEMIEAEKTYRAGLQLDPRSAALRDHLGGLLLATRPEEAARELEQGLASNPNQPALLITLAGIKLQQQRARPPERRNWADFDAVFKQAAAMAPQNTALTLMHAERLAADAGLDQAISFLTEAVAKAPQSVELATRLAMYLLAQGRPDQALQVLAKASDPKAAGDRAPLRIQRALALTTLGQGREARASLVRDLDRLSAADHDELWKFLVLLCKGVSDLETTRAAYDEWASQLPDDPRPKLALLEMAIEANDRDAIRTRLESLRPRDERGEFTWRLARARERLWKRSDSNGLAASNEAETERIRGALLKEADALVESVLRDIKIDPVALLLKGQILEEEGAGDKAADPYAQAWARGSAEALLRLIDLLVRLGRKPELERLRQSDTMKQLDQIEALCFLRHGHKAEALRVVQQSLSENPGRQTWQIGMLDVLGENEKAESTLQTAAERSDKLEPWLALLRFQAARQPQLVAETIAAIHRRFKAEQPELLEAECRWAASDWAAAEKAFNEAVKRYPKVRDVQTHAARYFEERGQRDRAEQCLRRVLAENPNDRSIIRQLAIMLTVQPDRPDAWKQALELLGPDKPQTDTSEDRLTRALVLAQSVDPAQLKQARDILEALVADLAIGNPVGDSARDVLAKLLLATGQPEQASRVLERMVNMGNDPVLIALYAETLLRSRKFAVLEEQLKRLATISQGRTYEANIRARMIQEQAPPGNAAAALEEVYLKRENTPGAEPLGRAAFRLLLGRGPEALEYADRLGSRLASHNAMLSWMPARVLAIRGDRMGALALCQTVVQSSAGLDDLLESGRVAFEVAMASRDQTTVLEKTDAVLASALAQAPDTHDLLMMRAMLKHLQGRFDEEVRLYRTMLERNPQDTLVLNNIAWALSEGIHQPSEALTRVDDVIQLAGRNPGNIDTRGVILMRLGRYDQAIEELKWVVQAKPTGVHYYHLAHAYHQAGRVAEFRAAMEQMRRAGLTVADLDPTERAEYQALIDL